MGADRGDIRKRHWFFASIVVSWVACTWHFNPRLLSLLRPDDALPAVVALLIFVALLDLFWLYGIYHCAFFLYRIVPHERPVTVPRADAPAVALLYTTCNDFSERAASSCLRQSHGRCHLFLLDDSTDPARMAAVDRFAASRPGRATVVRRSDRRGFKAGNLNHALRGPAASYEYFAVIDADEVIPPDFVERLLSYFSLDDRVAFVQAHHEMNPAQPSAFAQELGPGIRFHWAVYQPPRNDHGFVTFYGHGGIIRRDAWALAGGFPEVVSEDLAFSTTLRQLGFRGHFASDVTCYEDFPETYRQFRRRQEKWVTGACEYVHRQLLPFLRCRRVGLPEKLDVILSCFSLFLPVLFLVFLVVTNAVLPLALGEPRPLVVGVLGHEFRPVTAYFLEPRLRPLWQWDFFLMTLFGMFAPILCYLGSLITHPAATGRLLLKSCVPYVCLITVSTVSLLGYVFTRRAVFLTTGDREQGDVPAAARGTRGSRSLSNHPAVFRLEWLLGLALACCALVTVNVALLTIASVLVVSPLLGRLGWEHRGVSVLLWVPLLFVVIAFAGAGAGLLGLQGLTLQLLTVHF